MKKVNVLVGTFNKVKIVFTDTNSISKTHNNDKVIKFKVCLKKQKEIDGVVFLNSEVEFEKSSKLLYEQIKEYDTKIDDTLYSNLTFKYHKGVLDFEL